MEGIYLRKEDSDRMLARAKIVRAEFAQSIDEHWTKAPFRKNALSRKAALINSV